MSDLTYEILLLYVLLRCCTRLVVWWVGLWVGCCTCCFCCSAPAVVLLYMVRAGVWACGWLILFFFGALVMLLRCGRHGRT